MQEGLRRLTQHQGVLNKIYGQSGSEVNAGPCRTRLSNVEEPEFETLMASLQSQARSSFNLVLFSDFARQVGQSRLARAELATTVKEHRKSPP